MLQCRQIGGRLAVFVRSKSDKQLDQQVISAALADFVGSDSEVLIPLKALIGRSSFRSLIPPAGSGQGAVQCDALLAELKDIFAPKVLQQISFVLDGFLDLKTAGCLGRPGGPDRRHRPSSGR